MQHLETKLNRYIKVFFLFTRINYFQAMEYRANFIAAFLGPLLYGGSYILVLYSIISKVPKIAGWNFDQLLVLYSLSQLLYFLSWLLYRPSIGNFPQLVRTGKFDSVLKLPVNSKFIVSFKYQSISSVIPVLIWGLTFVYAIRNLTINPVDAFLFLVLSSSGLYILYNITFLAASLSFWIIEASDLVGLVEDVRDFSVYPISIFPLAAQVFLTFIIPTILIVYVPATAIMNRLNWQFAGISIGMAIATFVLSQKIWNIGLKRYSSASS